MNKSEIFIRSGMRSVYPKTLKLGYLGPPTEELGLLSQTRPQTTIVCAFDRRSWRRSTTNWPSVPPRRTATWSAASGEAHRTALPLVNRSRELRIDRNSGNRDPPLGKPNFRGEPCLQWPRSSVKNPRQPHRMKVQVGTTMERWASSRSSHKWEIMPAGINVCTP
jgi:hypothetical protein